MDYTTVLTLKQTLPMLNSVTTATSADLAMFITGAEAIVNAKVSRAYTVPVTPAPPLLTTLSTDLTLYRLLSMRFFTQEQMNKSVWPDRFKEAMELLDKVASGEIPLLTGSGTPITSDAGKAAMDSSTLNYQHTMTEDAQENQEVDTEKLDDIRATRGISQWP